MDVMEKQLETTGEKILLLEEELQDAQEGLLALQKELSALRDVRKENEKLFTLAKNYKSELEKLETTNQFLRDKLEDAKLEIRELQESCSLLQKPSLPEGEATVAEVDFRLLFEVKKVLKGLVEQLEDHEQKTIDRTGN